MRGALPALLLTGVVLGLGALACQGLGVSSAEIPERAIALAYYDVETARRRAETLAEAEPGKKPTRSYGVARVEDVTRYMGQIFGRAEGEENVAQRFPSRLALLDPRTQRVSQIRAARPNAVPRAWSPDGERLMFTQLVGEYRQMFEYDRTTQEVRRLTRGRGVHPDGCYGPEGRFVLARATVERGRAISRIQLTEPGGIRPRAISEGPMDYGPACAPDGRAIAWVSLDERGRDSLMVRMPALDGETRRLGPGRDPAFSPDGEWIVYSTPVNREWKLHRIRPDGSGRKAVGRGVFDERHPSFSPDGRLVVYLADDGIRKRIYLRRFDGTGDRVLLESGGGHDPVW
jgi:Tol biopolymer transport system component